jgi:hypothetical protein
MAEHDSGQASTPDATASVAQSRDAAAGGRPAALPEGDAAFTVSDAVWHHPRPKPYTRQPDDPVYRPLRIFALDPSVSRLDGAIASVNVPYEPLRRGPKGRLFHVMGSESCDLEDRRVLLQQGYAPSRSDERFHAQMLYAVCSSVYAAFKTALGREPGWGFERTDDEYQSRGALLIWAHSGERRNAHYSKTDGALEFGYFTAEQTGRGMMKGEKVFTCLSHDVIAHELTHALLDGLRPHFTVPTQIDVLAFHEAFADLVAVLQHFTYREIVLAAIRKSRGQITHGLLTDLARPLGEQSHRDSPLRRAVDTGAERRMYGESHEPHDLGSVLLLAVFDAFNTIYKRKTARYLRIATSGTGELPIGELPSDLQVVLAEEASQLASQFLSICVRAIDYCPPVDLEFGEFLRAVITADRELVPDDPWTYREAWIDAFRDRGIVPNRVTSLDEPALVWRPPQGKLRSVNGLSFAKLRFRGDPGRFPSASELRRQARELGRVIGKRSQTETFGLAPVGDDVMPPSIESIRSARRIGPDGQVVFDLIAEVIQRAVVRNGDRTFPVWGGSTIVLGPEGEIRYVIGKGATSSERTQAQAKFMSSRAGERYWHSDGREMVPARDLMPMLHGS